MSNQYCRWSKLDEEKFREVLFLFATGWTASECARESGVSLRAINDLYIRIRHRIYATVWRDLDEFYGVGLQLVLAIQVHSLTTRKSIPDGLLRLDAIELRREFRAELLPILKMRARLLRGGFLRYAGERRLKRDVIHLHFVEWAVRENCACQPRRDIAENPSGFENLVLPCFADETTPQDWNLYLQITDDRSPNSRSLIAFLSESREQRGGFSACRREYKNLYFILEELLRANPL